ncbi:MULTISPECIES: DUF4235 domain-containing protein [Aeromicrobium]|uniref:DUF4235 domain-containing protein n=1 Tax=Aeromicrobium phoceense TaxID=2754045 RepID=A0A838XP94_9ACTN|nr:MULTISPECIES: DUF4235 domain-containing protein [Aeromicrobium]MBA4608803.1 DUF4235 domain-containing protein [Aeromicrobium phoceense]
MARKRATKATPDPATTSPAEAEVSTGRGRGAWRALDAGSALLAASLAPYISNLAWRAVTGRKPPRNTRHPDLSTTEAIAWAAIGGATVQVVRTVARRGAATYWVRSTGGLPPGMRSTKNTTP